MLATALVAVATALCVTPPPGPDALTEFAASQWSAAAQSASASVADDLEQVVVGSTSLRFTTDGGFDTWLWSPPSKDATWDLSGSAGLRFFVKAFNPNCCGFQSGSPWVRLHSSPSAYVELRPTWDVLNSAINQWQQFEIPFAGNALWIRTDVGSPNLADVRFIEIHADTWEAGFTLHFDGLGFDLPTPPPAGLVAYAGNGRVDLAWSAFGNPDALALKVYRDTGPISDTTGLKPIATLPPSATDHVDQSARNGVSYHYAVTALLSGGVETTFVTSVGPRTPRDETDLQIVSIARTPRYPRYAPVYQSHLVTEPSGFGPYWFSAATGLGEGQSATTKRFPELGEPVTWTATIRNRGTNPWESPIEATWSYGGEIEVQHLADLALAPNATTTLSIVRPWPTDPVEITCSILDKDARPENNARSIASDSVAFLSYIDRTYEEDFRESSTAYPNAISDDLVDWLHAHMTRFNELFAEANCGKRVHYDVLETIADAAPDPDVPTIDFAIFPFRYRAGEGSLRLSGYYHADEDLDYGLLHEMGHQLGLIDLYRLDLPASQNQVGGTGYLAVPCLMHGVSPFLSAHSALAMNHWLDLAHGYYGQYLYALPESIAVRAVGANREPLVGATIRVYQKCERPGLGEVVTNQVKFTGTTGSDGVFMLPNVAIDESLVPPTFAGDVLKPNPFGYVAVVGTNGLFLIEAELDGFVDDAWLDITECNVAYWTGARESATFERVFALGAPIQRYPPLELTEQNAADWTWYADDGTVTLSDDPVNVQVGRTSLKAVATGGFDTALVYPGAFNASWDLSKVQSIRARFYAENPNIGFQNGSPFFRLITPTGWLELRPVYEVLNDAIGQWLPVEVSLAGMATWDRIEIGDPDLTDVRSLEIHADTWGFGFTLWVDGLHFHPQPMPPATGDLDGNGVVNASDLAILLGAWGPCDACSADLNASGAVDAADLAILLGAWDS